MSPVTQDILTGIFIACAALYILRTFFAKEPRLPQVRVKDMKKKR